MAITFNPSTSNYNDRIQQTESEYKVCPKCQNNIETTKSFSESEPLKSDSKKVKDNFIKFRKKVIDIGYVSLGVIKGGIYGAAAGFVTAGVIAVRNIFKRAPKNLGIGGKIVAGTVGLVVLAGHIVKSKLDANEEKAKLDHRWETGHNE